MGGFEITGAVKAEDVPQEARTLMQKGQWIELTEQIVRDRKRGLVTVVNVRAANRQELEKEIRRMKNGMALNVQRAHLKLTLGIVRENDTLAKVYLQTTEIAPPPAQRRNGR